MSDRAALARRVRGPAGEVALTAVIVGFAVGVLVAGGRSAAPGTWLIVVLLAAVGGCATLARRHPLLAVLAACPVVAGLGLLDVDATTDVATGGEFAAMFLLCFRVGSRGRAARSLPVVLLLAATADLAVWDVNPFLFMVTVGPWAGGVVAAARSRAQSELESRGRELALEQQRYAAEAMRYERARIARELHDIVAHCLSEVVVQAGAGDYVVARDPGLTSTVFDGILDSVRQAEGEIGRLVAVLGGPAAGAADPVAAAAEGVDQLVRRAQAAGLLIGYRLTGRADRLGPEVWDGVYRVIREAVTNALKHAPGAPIRIEVRCRQADVEVEVQNDAPRAAGLGLASTGGGYGLRGMAERVGAGGGRLRAGPAAGGGWLVAVLLPIRDANRV